MNTRIAAAAVVIVTMAGAPTSAVGPDFVEGSDAGSTPGTATVVAGSGSLNSISGNTSALTPGGNPDFEDMYLIMIDSPAIFTATTVPPDGMGPFDTQLWLFSGPTDAALGVLGNDDAPMAPMFESLLGPTTDDGTPGLSTPGLYYLAISGFPNVPLSGMPPVDPIFFLSVPTEVSGPDGVGGSLPIEAWSGPGTTGAYTIALSGCSFVAPPCPWDCAGEDGVVNTVDFLALLADWGVLGSPCDFGLGDPGVDTADFLKLLAAWGPCE